jgi:hypothetical protein
METWRSLRADERAAGLHLERHPDVPGAVCVGAHENNPSKLALVRAAGYEATRWEHTMTRAMDGPLPDVPPSPPDVTVTPYAAKRDEAIRRAHREAFAGHWGETPPDRQRWERSYTGSRAFRPDVSWLVTHGEAVCAYLLTYFWGSWGNSGCGPTGAGAASADYSSPQRSSPTARPVTRSRHSPWIPLTPPARSNCTNGPGSQ